MIDKESKGKVNSGGSFGGESCQTRRRRRIGGTRACLGAMVVGRNFLEEEEEG